jgi:hypothetical protein
MSGEPGLRAVGTVIEIATPPMNWLFSIGRAGSISTGGSGTHFTVWKYRIVGHSKVTDGRTLEQIEPVDEDPNPKYYAVTAYNWRYGMLIPVVPPEVLPLLDASWQ